ncbi:hypothetical protein H5410_032988 [Solanum commersonii]|uniref:Uncharacterized protein n=1 Tax=Solanum commersonii TaxID=4109 RepID=A0A9J5YME9_SOLCO|nr:hypothetical protein H5410_032988 [Solanum commersonii]
MGLSFSLVLRISWEKGKWRRKLPIKKGNPVPKASHVSGVQQKAASQEGKGQKRTISLVSIGKLTVC